MVDALVDGQAERAFSLLNVLLEGGEQRIGVLALITRQYRQMLYAKDMQESRTPQAQMAKALGRAALRPQPVDPAGGQAHDGAAEKAAGALRERGF